MTYRYRKVVVMVKGVVETGTYTVVMVMVAVGICRHKVVASTERVAVVTCRHKEVDGDVGGGDLYTYEGGGGGGGDGDGGGGNL